MASRRRRAAARCNGYSQRRNGLDPLATWVLVVVLAPMLALTATPQTSSAAEFAPPKQILGFYESDADIGPDQMPLTPVDGTTTNSESFIVRQLGPVDMEAGDCLDVSSREQFINPNFANGWWTVNGIRSEHWWLWVAGYASLRFKIGAPPTFPHDGSELVAETGQGWDAAMRRWQWETNEVRCSGAAVNQVYVFTTVRFASSQVWRQSDDQYIINDQTGALEAVHMGARL